MVHPWLAGVDPAGSLLVHAMGESRSRRRPRRPLPFPSVSIRWSRSRAHFVSGSPSPMPLEPWIGCSHWIGGSHPPSWRLRAARPPPSFKRHARPVTCAGRCPASRPPSPSGKAIRKSQVALGNASSAPLCYGGNHRIARQRRTKHPLTHRMQPVPRHAKATTARRQQHDDSRATALPSGPCGPCT